MARKRVTVTRETPSGRNAQFRDNRTGEQMSRAEFADKIEAGRYAGFHVRKLGGLRTPVSNPDGKKGNNLG